MFKIESYITPLLMGYLDKYVKLRPEDFQLSLWGGDAVLYNLDLRLDIIEKAMQLPIVFQSGHIHELRLHVPWTKLGSDPVVVTFNTIECILKLRDTAYSDRKCRAASETPGKSGQKQKVRKQEGPDLPPGYLQSLMNKIMNNVSIIVNNLIIKFVEDDIVLSLNVKSAECYSVDKNWNRAFVELLAPDFVLRRTVNFCDMTICLDKRDASGKIENYQDPMVYRCSASCRLYSKYENMHSKYPLETKLNIYCEKLDISLTDTQLPMFLRLIELCLALYYGTLEFKSVAEDSEPDQQSVDRESKTDSSVGEPPPTQGEQQQGWASWAWSYVPQILPDVEDLEEQSLGPPKKPPPLIFSLGMYAYKVTLKFKLTEFLKEKAHYGPKKICFKPFLYLEADGIALDMLMQGVTFYDAQFGITSLSVYSQGPCICGADGEENSRNNVLLSGGDNLSNKTTSNYICQSLFDQQSPENLGIPITKILDFEEHKQVYTEQYGVQKFGVFWLDYLYGMAKEDSPSNNTSSKSSVSSHSDTAVFVQETSLARFVIGPCHLIVTSSMVHRVQKFLDAAYKYDYEAYSKPQEERVDENRKPPPEEQLKSLEEFIPTRTQHLTLLQPVITILSAEHPYCDIAKKSYRSSQHKGGKAPPAPVLYPLFGLQIRSQRFDLQVSSPMYARKLVQLVSKVVGPSSNLLHHCHSHTQMKLFGFQVGLTKVDNIGARSPILTIVPPASGAMYTRRLLLTMYWTSSYMPKLERVYELPQMSLSISNPGLHVVMAIVLSWKQNNPRPADIMSNSLMEDVFPTHDSDGTKNYPVLETTLSGLEWKTCRNDLVTASTATLSSLHCLLYNHSGKKTCVIPIFSCPCDTDDMHTPDWLISKDSPEVEEVKNDCLMLTYQFPRKYDKIQVPAMALLNVDGMAVNLDPALQNWLSYKPVTKIKPTEELKIELDLELVKAASPLQTNLSQRSVLSSGSKRQSISLTRSVTTGQQSTLPAGNQENKLPDKPERSGIGEKLAGIFPLIRVMQVQVEMKKICLFLPKHHIELEEAGTNIVGNYQLMARSGTLCDTLVVCLPRVVVHSAGMKPTSALQEIPITSIEGSLVGEKIPWNVSLQNCSIYTVHCAPVLRALQLVKPATVTSTVGVSYKYTPPTSDNISALGLCLHTDMRSVTVSTSVEQVNLLIEMMAITLKTAKLTLGCFGEISKCFVSEPKPSQKKEMASENKGEQPLTAQTTSGASVSQSDVPYTQTSGDQTSLDTSLSRELEFLEASGEGVRLSLWLQWTLPKCEMRLYLKGKQGDTKISGLLEDITMSVDVQDVYSKLKLNIGAAGILHYYRQSKQPHWQEGEQEGILMSCRDNLSHDTHIVSSRLWSGDHGASSSSYHSNQQQRDILHGFCSLTFTRALRKNVRKRLQKLNIDVPDTDHLCNGEMLSQFYFHKYVSEICLNITPCDFIVCMTPLAAVLNNMSQLELSHKTSSRKHVQGERTPVPLLTTSSLPLLYADIANVRVFIPGEGSKATKTDRLQTTIKHDMFMLQVNSVSIQPQAENPLPRYPLDKELYQRAVQLGITLESGAALTDRQFQVDIKGLTVTSGCWSDFLDHKGRKTPSSIKTPATQIPAVEWNSISIRVDDQPEDVQLFPLLSPCDLKLVLAPALVNFTPELGIMELKPNVVCGYGLEFNVTSDLDIHISTNQMHLLHSKLKDSIKTLKSHDNQSDINSEEGDSIQDSGLGSEGSGVTGQRSHLKQERGQGQHKTAFTLTPIDLLLTAGRISCTLYSHETLDDRVTQKIETVKSKKKIKKHPRQEMEWVVRSRSEEDINSTLYDPVDVQDPYLTHMYHLNTSGVGSVIPEGTTCIKPFLFCYISQPHTVLSCQPDHQKFEMSFYDILIKGSPANTRIPVCDVKMLPDCSDFTEYWLETRPGQPNFSTGIPASLFTLTVQDFLNKPAKLALKIERPIKLNVSFSKIQQALEFMKAALLQQQTTLEKSRRGQKTPSTETSTHTVLRQLRSIDLQSEQIVVAMETRTCEEKPEILASFSSFRGRLDFHVENDEVNSVLLNTYIRDVFVKLIYDSHQLNMIGPFSVKADGTYNIISPSSHHFLSQSVVTIATGLVTIHFGQEHVLCLKLLTEHVSDILKELLPAPTSSPSGRSAQTEERASAAPPVDFITHSSSDDLRSGEFHYIVDTDRLDVVPRPGEIVFCNLDREGNSSMTWSYSEPRVISGISSTPIPFNISEINNEDNKVMCVLQYWEVLIQQFVDYMGIELLESEVTEVILPEVRPKNARELVPAQIWRMVVQNNQGEAVFPPMSLAASMKVDSCFVPSLIPTLQIGLTMETVKLHLSNHVHCLGKETPTKLKPFYMSASYQPTGEFAVISLDNILLAGSRWNGSQARNQLQFSSEISVDLLEYKTLTMERAVSKFDVSGTLGLQSLAKSQVLDLDVNCEPLTVRVGQGVVHNLSYTTQAWNQVFKDDPSKQDDLIFGHYVICNNTQQAVRFGQVGTDENLVLQPREMHQYGWRSHKIKQELHICLDGSVWKWCDAVDINNIGPVVRTVSSSEQQYTLIVSVKKLSNVQNQIIISGLVVVSNRLSEHMEVKVVTKEKEHLAVAGPGLTIPSYILEPKNILGIKFRLWGSNSTWSKEVYVGNSNSKENNLVKISTGSRTFHIWCRLIQHQVQSAQQVFIVLCPLYNVRSHLPYPLYINIDTSKLNLHEQIELPGYGRDLQLQCPGGDVHQALTFQFSAKTGKSSSSVTLSTGLIEQLQRAPEKFNPDSLNNYWKTDTWYQWPYSQSVILEENSPKPDMQSITVPDSRIGNQPTIDLNVSLSELWAGYQTVLIDVYPSVLVNNLCNLDLVFMGNEDATFDIHKGQSICLPKFESSFHLGVKYGEMIHMSEPVPVSEEEVEARRYRNDFGKTLFIDSYVTMPVFVPDEGQSMVYFLTVTSSVQHHIRVITLQEKFKLTNLTQYDLSACIFSVPSWSDKVDIPFGWSVEINSHLGCQRDQSDLQPLTLIPFVSLSTKDPKPSVEQTTDLVTYLVLKHMSKTIDDNSGKICENDASISPVDVPICNKEFDWTYPVRLVANESGSRMTTSLAVSKSKGVKQEALCVTGQVKNGVTYFTIQRDTAPACFIQNMCDFPLYYGQTLMNLSISGTTIQEETEMIRSLPCLPVNGAAFYTPPFLNTAFPQITDKHSIPKIHIAGKLPCDNVSQQAVKLKWSNPVDLLVAADNFVSIPSVTDVKVHVKQVAMVTNVTISAITKADVSAKEIRGRLSQKNRTVTVESISIEHVDAKITQSLKQALETGPVKSLKDKDDSKPQAKQLVITTGVWIHQMSLIVQNDSSQNSKGEIIRLTMDDVFLASYPASDLAEQSGYHRNCIVCSIGDLQFDNQLQAEENFDFPVVMLRQEHDKNPYRSDHDQLSQSNIFERHAILKSSSLFHAQLVFGQIDDRPSVIETVECSVKPMCFYIDDTFIFRCIKEAEGFLLVPLSIPDPQRVTVLKLPSDLKSLSRTLSNPIIIGHLSIQPVSVMFSIHASLKVFIASDHTPLMFGRFEKTFVCTTSYQLIRSLVMHYASGALFRAGAVVGSLEILGNPTGLVRSIGTGVADFFRMPYRGLTKGPGAFVMGVSEGTSSMFRNITTGMLNSVTNFASSVSRNMDRLSLDSNHQKRQEESRRHRPDGLGDGLKQGLTGFGISLLGAVAGLADQPIQNIVNTEGNGQSRTSTASGLMTGVGKGLVGVFTKPIGGAAEFVSQTGQGILQGTGLSRLPKPRTAPVVIDIISAPCGQVKYSLKLLQTLPSNDILCCMEASHIDLTDEDVPVTLILTPEILFVVNHEEDSQQQSFSIMELECGVTQGQQPILSIVWKDSQTFPEEHETSKTERVTAFIDAATKYITQSPWKKQQMESRFDANFNRDDNTHIEESPAIIPSTSQSKGTLLQSDMCSLGKQSGSEDQGGQLSDTVSDSSTEPVRATLPQYDFKMSATNLAAFLAIFTLTKHKLAGIGFAV